jgi:hypothetical protein
MTGRTRRMLSSSEISCEGTPEAAAPHGRVLLSDTQELEPDSLDLERTGKKLRAQARRVSLTPQNRLDFRLPFPHELQQEAREQLDNLLRIRCGAGGRRVGRLRQRFRREGLQRCVRHTTRSRRGAPLKKRRRFSSARIPIATRVSLVALPR